MGNGVYVSAGSTLWWAELPAAGGPLSFQSVALEVPAANTIGGISFDGDTAYVPFQTGTSGKNPGGSIVTFQVTAGNPRTFSSPTTFYLP